MQIPMSSPDVTDHEIEAVVRVLRTSHLSNGPVVKQFEDKVASMVGVDYAAAVNSGTSGLHLTMVAAGIGPGDEVITSSFSFVASANCVLYVGASPIFVDIDPITGNLIPELVEAAITENTKAIMVVHVFGQPADMDAIMQIAKKHDLLVIEDACEAVGAEYKGQQVGSFGDAAVFAFYPNKQMTTGEGGIVLTGNREWQDLYLSLRNQGRDIFNEWLTHARLGYNYRLDEMSAALGLAQLERLDEMMQKRSQVADWYDTRIDVIDGVHKPVIMDTTTRMSWFVYAVRLDSGIDRVQVMNQLKSQGIPSRPYFTPIHLQPFYQERLRFKPVFLPHTEEAGRTFLALPFSSVMKMEQVDYVCEYLHDAVTVVQKAGS